MQTPPCYPIDLRRRWHRWRRRDHGGGFQILSLRPAPCRPIEPARVPQARAVFVGDVVQRFLALRAGRAKRPIRPRKFTRERTSARRFIREYFVRFPNERYHGELEWRELQSQNIEFTMKRLREPIERATEIAK